jgi:hypothetical protein
MSLDIENLNSLHPPGHFLLYRSSQYWMKTSFSAGASPYTNCSQPSHSACPAHAGVEKKLEFSCSEKVFGAGSLLAGLIPVSVAPGLTLGNDPTALVISPGTSAE